MAKKKKKNLLSLLTDIGMSEQQKSDIETKAYTDNAKSINKAIKKTATAIAKSEQAKADTETNIYKQAKKSAEKSRDNWYANIKKREQANKKQANANNTMTATQQQEVAVVDTLPMEAQKQYYKQNKELADISSKAIEKTITEHPMASGFVQGFSNAISFGTSGDLAENTSEATGRKINSYNNSDERYESKQEKIEADLNSGKITEEQYKSRMAKAEKQYNDEAKGRRFYKAGKIVGETAGYLPTGNIGAGVSSKLLVSGAKAALKKEGTELTGKALTEEATKLANSASKAKKFVMNRVGDAIGGQAVNIPIALSESKDKNGSIDAKTFAKQLAVNTAADVAAGGALEGITKTVGKAVAKKAGKSETKAAVAKDEPYVAPNSIDLVETKAQSHKKVDAESFVKKVHRELVNSLGEVETIAKNDSKAKKKEVNQMVADAVSKVKANKGLTSAEKKSAIKDLKEQGRKYIAKADEGLGKVNALRLSGGKSDTDIHRFQTDINGREVGKSLEAIERTVNIGVEKAKTLSKKAVKKINETRNKAFQDYAFHLHNLDRSAKGTPVFADPNKYDMAVDIATSKKAIADYEKQYPEFKQIHADLMKYLSNLNDKRVAAGLISKERREMLDEMFANYVPTFRDIENGKIKEGKRAKGSDKPLLPLFEQIAEQTRQVQRDIDTNDAIKYIANNTESEKLGVTPELKASEAADTIEVDPRDETTRTFIVKDKVTGKPTGELQYYDKGNIVRVQVKKEIAEALQAEFANGKIGNEPIDAVNSFLGRNLTSIYKALLTNLSPAFIVRNMARDFPEALINSKNTVAYVKSWKDAAQAMTHKDNPWRKLFDSAGVSKSNFSSLDSDVFKKGTKLNVVKKLNVINDITESFPRAAEFIATLKTLGYTEDTLKNVTREDLNIAALNASDVTVNFARSGRFGKFLNRGTVPFFNPSIQGVSKYYRNLTEGSPKQVISVIAKAATLGIAPPVINEILLQDDENYQKLTDYTKYNNYIIPIGDNMYFKLPMARVLAVLGIPFKNAVSPTLGDENEDNFTQIIRVIENNVAPVNLFESNIFSAFFQAKNNKSWFGTPIDSEQLYGDTNLSEHYDEGTTIIARTMAQLLNKVGGEVSPKIIDYLAEQLGGVAYDLIAPLVTPENLNKYKKNIENELGETGASTDAIKTLLSPITEYVKGAFVVNSDTQNTTSSNYYDRKEQLERDVQDGVDGADAESEAFRSYSSRITNANNVIDALVSSNGYGDKVTQAKIQKQAIMEAALSGATSTGDSADLKVWSELLGTSETMELLGTESDKETYKTAVENGVKDKDWIEAYGTVRDLDKQNCSGDLAKAMVSASMKNDALAKSYDVYDEKSGEASVGSKYARATEYLNSGGTMDTFKSYQQKLSKAKATTNKSLTAMVLAKNGAEDKEYALYGIDSDKQSLGQALADSKFSAKKYTKAKVKADTDNNGSVTKAEAMAYCEKKYGTTEKRSTMFALLCPSAKNPYGNTYGVLTSDKTYEGTSSSTSSGSSGSSSSSSSSSKKSNSLKDIEPIVHNHITYGSTKDAAMTASQIKTLMNYLHKQRFK